MTGDFYVTTELAKIESSTAHDRAGSAKAGAHDSVTLCCVASEEVMHARKIRPGVHDKPWARMTKVSTL